MSNKKTKVNCQEIAKYKNKKVVVDTNIFLQYLWIAEQDFDNFIALILDCCKSIVFTQQNVEELYRNIYDHFDKNKNNKLGKSKIEIDETVKKYLDKNEKEALKKLSAALADYPKKREHIYSNNQKKLLKFLETDLKKFTIIERTDDIVQRAIARKFIGNPPYSDKKNTGGDEIIWESLLSWRGSSIVIATNDKGFVDNEFFLSKEYEQKTEYKLIKIVSDTDLTQVLQDINATRNSELLENVRKIEKNIQEWRNSIPDYTQVFEPLVAFSRQLELYRNGLITPELIKAINSWQQQAENLRNAIALPGKSFNALTSILPNCCNAERANCEDANTYGD